MPLNGSIEKIMTILLKTSDIVGIDLITFLYKMSYFHTSSDNIYLITRIVWKSFLVLILLNHNREQWLMKRVTEVSCNMINELAGFNRKNNDINGSYASISTMINE